MAKWFYISCSVILYRGFKILYFDRSKAWIRMFVELANWRKILTLFYIPQKCLNFLR